MLYANAKAKLVMSALLLALPLSACAPEREAMETGTETTVREEVEQPAMAAERTSATTTGTTGNVDLVDFRF